MAPPPKDEPLLDLDEIQGNVLPGFKKDHQHFLFFSINDTAAARAWLNKLHARLSSAALVLDAHRVWKRMKKQLGKEPNAAQFLFLNVALSASGLAKLTSKAEVDDFGDDAFKLGQSERSTLVGDPASAKEPGHAAGWLVGGPKHAVDGVLILASDDLTWLEGEQAKLATELATQGMKIEHEDRGDVGTAPARGHEQFGFKDDISRPAVRGRWPTTPYDFVTARTLPSDATFDSLRADFAAPGSRLIWPGHVVFGYGRQAADDPRTYDASNQAKGPAWAKNGSLMVYRRLRQHTDSFWKFVEDATKRLAKTHPKSAPDKDRLAACLIGRWKSGTPLARSPDKDIGITGDGLNYFAYASKQVPPLPGDTALETADPDGLLCPLGAHIRKVNPRDQATDLGMSERTPPRSILRRGITYAATDSDKGLLFVAYQSSIVDQFEFLMRMWVNKENTPRDHGGFDPILSRNPDRAFYLPIDGKVEKVAITKTFVEPTGGEYFFAPSIGFFKNTLAGSAQKQVTEDVQIFELPAAQSAPYAESDSGFEEQATAPPPTTPKTRVSDPFAIPFRWMARVSIRNRNSEESHGSGVLISDVHVLTAAHVVWKATVSPAEYSVEVALAQDGSNFLDIIGVSRIDIPARYKDGEHVFDYSILTLARPVADRTYKDLGGVRLCYWGSSTCGAGTTAKPVDPAGLNGQVAITAGYPRDKGGKEMWVVTGTMSRSVGGTVAIHYTGELIEGQSGSPAWIEQNGERNIVGLVVSRGTFNRLYPLSWDMVLELNGWMLRAEKTESEAEVEFEGDQSEDHKFKAGGDIVLRETAEGELEEDGVEPKGLTLLDHVHIPKAPDPLRPGKFTIGSSTKLVAADLNPQFYDSAGVLKLDSSPTGLQTCLDAMMKNSFGAFLSRAGQTSPHPDDVAHVAVVDLTGAKRSAPEFAAWGASVDMYGASVPKILALHAAFQLRSDLRDLMTRTSASDGKQLEAAAIAEWNAKGYKTDLPDLVWLFDIRKWTLPSALDFTPAARDTFANIVHNCPAGTLIIKVSMPFIGSVAWQSGLYHPMSSGLWLRASYCDKGTWASPVKTPWVHNVTALSAATYFTLLAQGRLVDTASSKDIKNALQGGCVTRLFPSLPVVASKCGWYDGWIHDCAWIQDGSLRYVMAVLSHQTKPAHEAVYTQLCAQIDTLVRLNNQTPKASCS